MPRAATGGDGNDRLFGGAGVDVMFGGAGNGQFESVGDNAIDSIFGNDGADPATVDEADVLNSIEHLP